MQADFSQSAESRQVANGNLQLNERCHDKLKEKSKNAVGAEWSVATATARNNHRSKKEEKRREPLPNRVRDGGLHPHSPSQQTQHCSGADSVIQKQYLYSKGD